MSADLYPGETRDQSLVIDVAEFYRSLDIVREGLKRMVNNHEYPTYEREVANHIAFLDLQAEMRADSERFAASLFPREPQS